MPKWLTKGWETVKDFGYRWLGALFMREKAGGKLAVSLSRTTFVGIIVYLFSFWNAWKPASLKDIGALISGLKLPEGADAAGITAALTEALAGMPAPDSLPPGLMEVFYTVAGIAFGTKLTDAIKNKGTAKPPV